MRKCKCCGSNNTELVTRVTGYFSKNSQWNRGKIAELRERFKNKIKSWKK